MTILKRSGKKLSIKRTLRHLHWSRGCQEPQMNEPVECCPVVCRQQQIELLSSLLGNCDEVALPSLFVYGHTATGKSATVKYVLRKHITVSVNCVECFSSRLMFEAILDQLVRLTADATPYTLEGAMTRCRCDKLNDFVRMLQHVFKEEKILGKSTYIILERAERLRDMDSSLLPLFLRLQELSVHHWKPYHSYVDLTDIVLADAAPKTGLNLGVIMESEIVWDKFRIGTGFPDPYVVHFPNYSKDELLEIISRDSPTSVSPEFYRSYANLLLSVFHVVCRSLSELRHLAAINFSTYMEPIRKGDASMEDTRKLWHHIEPYLKKAMQTVYLHELSGTRWEQMTQSSAELTQSSSALSSRTHVELPVYSKYLVIAAYLASYNPAKSDRRFFSKNAGKLSKRAKTLKQKNEHNCCHLLGPKVFPFDRFMAVFYAIVGSVPATTNVYSQITSLVTLGLLIQVNVSDLLEVPKFKCLVSLDFVKSISRSVNFEVQRYLWDFI